MDILKGRRAEDLIELASSLTCGLTIFEVIRNPRIAQPSEYRNVETSLNESGLRDEISCAICSGIVHKCVVIKTCLHRFCSSCIEKCVRIGQRDLYDFKTHCGFMQNFRLRECPKCRKHVPSRRFLKPDPIYDSIISRLIPNVKVFEELSDTFTMALNKGMKNDSSIDIIRSNFLDENPKIDIETLNSDELQFGELSMTSLFDNKLYMREIKQKRKTIVESLPRPPPHTHLVCLLIADGTLPQISPNEFYGDGLITIHHLSMYIKTTLKVSPTCKMFIYTKEPKHIAPPTATITYLRNMSCLLSHERLDIYYTNTSPPL